jgi:hypothetical protein
MTDDDAAKLTDEDLERMLEETTHLIKQLGYFYGEAASRRKDYSMAKSKRIRILDVIRMRKQRAAEEEK